MGSEEEQHSSSSSSSFFLLLFLWGGLSLSGRVSLLQRCSLVLESSRSGPFS